MADDGDGRTGEASESVSGQAPLNGPGSLDDVGWFGAARWGLLPVLQALLVSIAVVAGYHMTFYEPPLKVATVDLEAVMEAKQLQFAELVTRPGATDADREKAMGLVDAMAPELNRAVAQLVSECGCLVFLKNAVVGQAAVDLTGSLKAKMNVADVDVSRLRSRVREGMGGTAARAGGVAVR